MNGRPLYFASGSNRPGEIRGFAAIGQAIGVAAPEVSPNAERELVALAGTGVQVFVDSGAFSEVAFGPEGVRVVKPITEIDWRRRLGLYRRLAQALGSQVHVVAPDRIGDQEETLARLASYAHVMRELRELGANILVPVQKGTRSQAAFVRDVAAVLGFDDFVHAIPSKKKATTIDELRAYLTEVRPERVHFLGLGLTNPSAGQVRALLDELVPDAVASFDSNMICANVGRGRGPAPRRLTRARDSARELIEARGLRSTAQELGIILCFGSPEQIADAIAARAA